MSPSSVLLQQLASLNDAEFSLQLQQVKQLSEVAPPSEQSRRIVLSVNDPNLQIQLADYQIKDLGEEYLGYAKVPIAVLGSWKHPDYGTVEFVQDDFDQMIKNFSDRVTGYEPPLFVGHPVNDDTVEGAPATGFLVDLAQESDVLFGFFGMVDAEVYQQLQDKKYRYSSAEYIPSAISKETGEKVGTVLVGCALTNRPHLTRMPRVETLSDCTLSHTCFLFELKTSPLVLSDPIVLTPQEPISMSDAVNDSPAVAVTTTESKLDLSERILTLTQQIQEANAKATQAELRAAKAEEVAAKIALSEKLARIQQLNLSAAIKEEYSAIVKDGVLDAEQETKVMGLLQKMSESSSEALLQQHGSSEETDKVNNPESYNPALNPFQKIIDGNQKLAEERQQQRRISMSLV